ncbi:response regulator transcription factor [Pontivivens ytuae]|uniref:Response regulator transcription factor n=1 Tax=Pontivivens ytuae TaxID=2789856 RepID=A0A7S9LRT0_9RHOB|nr:response regulator [Pontivivens ytuae]QPH54121.1 response regulator transcription factor [Pontivivens ytuae]
MQGAPVGIVEDDGAVAASLAALLGAWGFEAELFEDGETFLAAAAPGRWACVLLDVRLPGDDGLSVMKAFRGVERHIPVIIMTGHGDISMAVHALKEGAQDFIEKPFDDEDLVRRLRTAIARTPEGADCAARLARLTPRETDVMREVVAGHPNKIIAHRLGVSPKTVELHRARVMSKTGAKSLSHLVRMALKAGIDPDGDAQI